MANPEVMRDGYGFAQKASGFDSFSDKSYRGRSRRVQDREDFAREGFVPMIDPQYLLTDEQMAQFITHGFVQLRTDFPDEFHQALCRKMKEVYEKEGNPGNNLVPRIPEIQALFDHPTVKGALTSVLGPDYYMHAHRHGHYNPPGTNDGGWHKDNYWGNEKTRNHVPWSAMIFYYPQTVTEDMGPTGVMPGSQNRYKIDAGSEINLPVTGKAGTFVLIDYDIWHRATANRSDRDRFMLKFLFFRLQPPKAPEWNNQRTGWKTPDDMLPVKPNPLLWEHVWNWMSGNPWKPPAQRAETRNIATLESALRSEDENEALNAAYELAAIGEEAIPALLRGLKHQGEDVTHPLKFSIPRLSAHAFAALGPKAVPALCEALNDHYENREVLGQVAYALGEMMEHASPAVPRLIELLSDDSPFIRQHAAEALGMIRKPAERIVTALCEALEDSEPYVRFTAALALARIGPEAKDAVNALKKALNASGWSLAPILTAPKGDKGARYLPAAASCALKRIGTPEALEILVHYLETSRWCPVTAKTSTY